MIEKNQIYNVEIIDDGYQGEGIAKINNLPIFIQGAIKGEKVEIKILKVQSSFAYGKIINIIKKSEARVSSDCDRYNKHHAWRRLSPLHCSIQQTAALPAGP